MVMDPRTGDRTLTVPPHTGDTVLPNLPFFEKLLRYAHRRSPPIAIRDVNAGIERTYLQLLTDAIALRRVLKGTLNQKTLKQLENDEEVFIALVAPGGYEYAVGFIAILALGAAVVPITPALPVQEAKSLVQRAQCVAVISSNDATPLAQGIKEAIRASDPNKANLPHAIVSHSLQRTQLPASSLTISSSPVPNMNNAGLVIFTSGTTGPPKGAVQRRSYISSAAEDVADHYRLNESDTVLHLLPVHHATGIGVTFLPLLVVGGCIEFRSGSFDPAWTWERLRRNATANGCQRLTVFSGVPTIYTRLMRYFETHIAPLPINEQEHYIAGVRDVRVFLCGTSALPRPIQDFWTRMLDGRQILTRYGGTEFHTVLKADIDGSSPANSVGRVSPGVDLKLSNEGEILVKGPNMFSKYLNAPEATASAHDEEGYFRTGDIAFKSGENYFIQGRASLDIIKSGGYKISALDIEREVLGLEYVSEVMVVGVEDEEFGQRVAAVVTLKDSIEPRGLRLQELRKDLRGVLAGYKMPTVLRIVDGEIPKGATGKVQKKVLRPRYFPDGWRSCKAVQIWDPVQAKAKL
ncbi:uncharacterized protein DSM5745_03975 [Aspergillus mulundensis]|uniref:Uncharacterized protein n=1 Tax=Aspergillus mulundensis TaxID=1810919 RepID=A0A3D8SBA9_9EURO|nr:Uncharacterized protein DSM5745_03975 [Aspergillus mulundensis]RDW83649.1 Uncharacterized protein DSM5745_03975 [Aspergillus mulundensis]